MSLATPGCGEVWYRAWMGFKRPRVRISALGPNKVDSFDTRVSETINLFLFAKMLATQGFLVLWFYGIVSLWVSGWDFSPLWMPSFCIDNSHAETFLWGIVSAWLQKFHCDRGSFRVNKRIFYATWPVNVPTDFDTKRKSPLRHKSAEKSLKSRASEVNCWLRKPFFRWFDRSALPFKRSAATWHRSLAVYGFWNN